MSARVLLALGAADGRSRWVVEHDGRSYAVFERDGELVVTDALCPHRGGPLIEGLIRDGAIVCPWHWYAYDLTSGKCRTTKQYELATYPVLTCDGALFAEVPVAKPSSWSSILRAHAVSRRQG
jgi:nitrite reductase (NADH) small subunit